MASVQLPVATLTRTQFPDVCAVSGRPTPRRVALTFRWVPSWRRNAMWLPAPLLVLANRVDRQQLTLSLPLSEQVSRQYTRRWRAAMLLLGTGAVGLVALPVLRTPWLLVAALLAGIAGAVSFVLARRRLPRLTVDEAGVAKLVGVSPEFRDALVVEATAGPGDGH